jgi:hypothetical protein
MVFNYLPDVFTTRTKFRRLVLGNKGLGVIGQVIFWWRTDQEWHALLEPIGRFLAPQFL